MFGGHLPFNDNKIIISEKEKVADKLIGLPFTGLTGKKGTYSTYLRPFGIFENLI